MSRNKKRVGILTHYYKSRNFGGLLQAYALCRVLRELGRDAEQICYRQGDVLEAPPRPLRDRLKDRPIADIVRSLRRRIANRLLKRRFKAQTAAMYSFGREEIPHSVKVYTKDDIRTCRDYDAYITGSDQVWNLDWYEPAYFLDFVPTGKPKIAYAASIGHAELSEEQADLFRGSLRDYSAISVREKDAAELILPLSPVPVGWTLDPVLLLKQQQWDEICSDRLVKTPYLFCYFLGADKQVRKLAAAYGKKKRLKVVFIPYIHGSFRKCDFGFGDTRLYKVSPKEFISLIKHAEYVFTDSFHATAFSELYRTPYAVFRRDGTNSMTSRIYSVTSIFESRERFCDTDEKGTLEYIESLPPMEQEKEFPLLESMREKSYRFLKDSLSGI